MRPSSAPGAAVLRFLRADLRWSHGDLAFLFGIDRSTVRRWLRDAGVRVSRTPRKPPEAPKTGARFFEELAAQTEMGWSPGQARHAFAWAVRRAQARTHGEGTA